MASTLTYARRAAVQRKEERSAYLLKSASDFVDEDGDRVNELFPNEGQTLWHGLRDGNLKRMNRPTKTRVIKETSPIAEAGVQF
ncbi:hypothetical protein [Mesotoga prima]|uniref:hypothetical protein n=1 Tax=Mesotoga prima TaxID=1184387 RepID=UPI002FD95047